MKAEEVRAGLLSGCQNSGAAVVTVRKKDVEKALGPKAADVLKTATGNSKELATLNRKSLIQALESESTPAG